MRKSRKVWKFGGSSLDTVEKRALLSQMIVREVAADLVIVVSAQAGHTDKLLADLRTISCVPADIADAYVKTAEEQSAALMAASIVTAGRPAEVLPPTLLFACNDRFGDADVLHVNPSHLLDRFDRGVVPVVAGFFGAAPDGRVCVLGRGGSDYTAVLIGAALCAPVTLFKNDVDGIYDRNPNSDSQAQRYDRLSHTEALALSMGAKVLNAKAALTALKENVTVIVRSTFGPGQGTVIATDGGNQDVIWGKCTDKL